MDDVEAQAPAAASPTSAEVTETEAPHPLPESEIPWHHDPEFETHGPLYDSWILKDTSHAERYGEWSNGAFIFVSCSFRLGLKNRVNSPSIHFNAHELTHLHPHQHLTSLQSQSSLRLHFGYVFGRKAGYWGKWGEVI